jgi:ribonuclease HI
MAEKRVVIFTDGASQGNPGPGGWGAVLNYSGRRKELSGGYRFTTNNRMELFAAIRALEALKEPCLVLLYSDSRYLVDTVIKGWALRWQAKGWRRSNKPVPNADLWQRLLALCQVHSVTFTWVAGHSGHIENERCDLLAKAAAMGRSLPIDQGYELAKKDNSASLL